MNGNHIKIAETANEDRPRERLLTLGPNALLNHELLAIIIGSGTQKESVTELSRRIIAHYNHDLSSLAKAEMGELQLIDGIGPAKASQISAAFTLAKRLIKNRSPQRIIINNPSDTADFIREEMRLLKQEEFHVILLDTRNGVIHHQRVTTGLLDRSQIHPREVFKPAIHHNSHKVILVHNHPSGDPTPSIQDIEATKTMVESGNILGITVADHVVMGHRTSIRNKDYVSLRERELM